MKAKKIVKKVRTRVTCITCPFCMDTIYSRAVHDYHTCTCGEVAIDGGFDYTRIQYDPAKMKMPKSFHLFVSATRVQLGQDWGTGADKFGVIHLTKVK